MEELKNKKIILTGGSGFIGSHILDALKGCGMNVESINGDILDTDHMRKSFAGAFAVIHQAGLPPIPLSVSDPLESHRVNVTGSLSVLVAARDAKVDRVIYASSTTVYGNNQILPKIEALIPDPCSPYSLQKYEVELNAKLFYELYGLKTIGLRYSNVYGSGQNLDGDYVPVVSKFISLMKEGKVPQIFGDGKQVRDFVHVDDVTKANILALSADSGYGEVYNIGSGESISLLGLVDKINKILNTNIEPKYLPKRQGDNPDSVIDITKAKKNLGYIPEVMFNEGLLKTIKHFK